MRKTMTNSGGAVDRAPRTAAATLAVLAGLTAPAPSLAQGPTLPSYGHDFVTVGAPGNRAALASERDPNNPFSIIDFPTLGAVNYSYRITRNETRVSQWFDFVRAYSPYADQDGLSRGVLSGIWGIGYSSLSPNIAPNWTLDPAAANVPANVIFPLAALYCNWLHNGRPTQGPALTRAAFETGAYAITNSGLGQPIPTRLPGAQYWIPSNHEWVKATYYDPNRYGEGQEGYWPYSGRSATPLIGGPPGVGQTSAGWAPTGGQYPPNVGSYPGTVSPWGLLDTSGGMAEFTDTQFGAANDLIGMGDGLPSALTRFDRLGQNWGNVSGQYLGFRVASHVPPPASAALWVVAAHSFAGRRRRMT